MKTKLLVIYPPPKDPEEFDRRYAEEHLPFATPRLTGATGVVTQRAVGAPGGTPTIHAISEVSFPSLEVLQRCAQSESGQQALAHATSISTGGPPQFVVVQGDG